MKSNLNIEELKVYSLSMDLGEKIWNCVVKWDYIAKDTIGKQIVKSADSVAANISEGFGKYFYKENSNFNYDSRGSLYETKTWLTKSFKRDLIDKNLYNELSELISNIARMLNAYIKTIGSSPNELKEPEENYDIDLSFDKI